MARVTQRGSVAKNKTTKIVATPKGKTKSNASILNFFKKAPAPEDESMFVAGSADLVFSQYTVQNEASEAVTSSDAEGAEDAANDRTGNGYEGSAKRRKLNHELAMVSETVSVALASSSVTHGTKQVQRGPFLDDSDLESDEDVERSATTTQKHGTTLTAADDRDMHHHDSTAAAPSPPEPRLGPSRSIPKSAFLDGAPPHPQEDRLDAQLLDAQQQTGVDDVFGEFFDDDFEEDENFEGEEYRERKFMEEQARLEAADDANDDDGCENGSTALGVAARGNLEEGSAVISCCPICAFDLAGRTADEATIHVNACLDGLGAEPARVSPSADQQRQASCGLPTTSKPAQKLPISDLSKRFMRTAALPRPGQANPIVLGGAAASMTAAASGGDSAFAKLMSGHVESAAWVAAAAAENASRGKPAYERTCPFYKIMPGFFICVDAFRYGAVEGCRAYFLSHFHSDHYVGLTAKWCHGPIYCSKVTGSLVKSQLGTAATWVVELDFEDTVDVPGTDGVRVTMIPANHCPGSSLFLFEKTLAGKRATQRILHCGDFRACPAQVSHPLLRPETVDALSGKTKQQKIDVCYLDTTYLNPRYSFPPQDDVVAACADLCAALDQSLRSSRETEWDRTLGRREGNGGHGNGNVRDFFLAQEPESETKTEGHVDRRSEQPTTTVPDARLAAPTHGNRLLVVCGTYSIGKERICKAIAQALRTKIYASPAKICIVSQLGDPELTALMTSNPLEAQVHMQMLMEIRAETLAEYLAAYRQHFSRIVGFRPSGWNYRPTMANNTTTTNNNNGTNGKNKNNPGTAKTAAFAASANLPPSTVSTASLLHGPGWRTRFGQCDLVPQRGSTKEAMCFGVPYSEHSSFRELALFLMALRIEKVVPTVNVGSEQSRRRMKAWIDRWLSERRRGGMVRVLSADDNDAGNDQDEQLWGGKEGLGGNAYW
ncbi:DNA repair protein pso2 [Niveomyces insectorum RCEF 264]|uniref:DNA repair protein pso2 n=1 Tax=Niveomyces insectorum RCEF 264 TaxID=1081102 RepID=A0A167WZA7_9HYPO|nr:DNA repair protein pso2 [Niveomyces insectorum RCEF 264]